MTLRDPDSASDAVDSQLIQRPVTVEVAEGIARQFPEAKDSLAHWIQSAAEARDWSRVERFANLGAAMQAPGLAAPIIDILEANVGPINEEDLVDILGEIKATDAADTIFRVLKRSIDSDAPAYWLCQKAILSLSELETPTADHYLRELTNDSWPNPIRWHAAVALCIEDELNFDEDSMLE